MKAQDTIPAVTTLASAALAAPPVLLVGALVGAGLIWLFSNPDKPRGEASLAEEPAPDREELTAQKAPAEGMLNLPGRTAKRVTREDVAEALAYGARPFTRKEAVRALSALGFRKTAAYNALAPEGRFGHFIQAYPDGLVEWIG